MEFYKEVIGKSFSYTAKPVLSSNLKIAKTKVLKANGRIMHSAILLTCIKR